MKYLLIILCLALFACTKAPDLLETTELPDTAFTWSTVSITQRGVKQSLSLVQQNMAVEMPQIRLRFGVKEVSSIAFKAKALLSVTARAGLFVTGTATVTMLEGDTLEPIIANRETGSIHAYTGTVNTTGSVVRTFQVVSSSRPCLRITFDVTSSLGTNFKRLSSAPICPGVAPVDLSIKLKTPVQTLYRSTNQMLTLRLERPMSPDNPLRLERLVVTVPNVANLRSQYRVNAPCLTQENTLTCEGSLGQTGNDPRTMDVQIFFDALTTDPISITATYTSQALETILGNNTTVVTLPVLEPPNADLALTWTAPTQTIAGQMFPVTVNITNLGTVTSTARKFTASLGNIRVSSSPSNCGFGNASYTCVIPPISPNGTHTLTWSITPDYPQTVYLEALVYWNNLDWDLYANNYASIQIQALQDPATITDVIVAISATPDPPQIASGQQYTVTVTNTSSNPAQTVELQFYSQAGVQFSTSNCSFEFNLCNLGTLAALESRVITLTTTSTPNQAEERISAYVSTTSPESNSYNNSSELYISFPGPDFALSLSSTPNPVIQATGQQHSFTVQNVGTLSSAFDLRIYVSGNADFSVDNNQCYELRPKEFYCYFPSLAANQSQTITLTSTSLETLSNTSMFAAVNSYSSDADTSNNQVFEEWQFEP